MSAPELSPPSHCYFALPRLWLWMNGGSVERKESNAMEAYPVGVAMFLISYAAVLAPLKPNIIIGVLLLFVTWLAWLIVVYANSFLVRAARPIGLFRELSNARAQNVLIGIEITACASLLIAESYCSVVGWMWIAVVALDRVAAVALRAFTSRDA